MKQYINIDRFMESGDILISNHARIRMFERNISTDELISAISSGEIIEDYPDDDPCPSVLLLGFTNMVPIHIVIAVCKAHIRIITVYMPEESKWIDNRKRRIDT